MWVLDAAGATLGLGYYNPATTIAVRMLALGGEPGPAEIIGWRMERALETARDASSVPIPIATGCSMATATASRASSSIATATLRWCNC